MMQAVWVTPTTVTLSIVHNAIVMT
jgi:hypothetical protein